MEKENRLPKRKHPRLGYFDYSSAGAYFITICTHDKRHTLSRVVEREAETIEIELTAFGRIAEKQLLLLENRYPYLEIDQYVIMPNHIHAIVLLTDESVICSRHTLTDIVCAYKSLTARQCKRMGFIGKLFQASFYEHIIRGKKDYEEMEKYISANPMRWYYDKFYTEE